MPSACGRVESVRPVESAALRAMPWGARQRVQQAWAAGPWSAGPIWWGCWLLAWPAAAMAVKLLGLPVQATNAAALAWLLIGAPVLEELALRPLLQQGLALQARSWGWSARHADAAAIGSTCAVFVAAHALRWPAGAPMWWALAWSVPACALGITWTLRRRWTDCAALHAHFNLVLWIWSAG